MKAVQRQAVCLAIEVGDQIAALAQEGVSEVDVAAALHIEPILGQAIQTVGDGVAVGYFYLDRLASGEKICRFIAAGPCRRGFQCVGQQCDRATAAVAALSADAAL